MRQGLGYAAREGARSKPAAALRSRPQNSIRRFSHRCVLDGKHLLVPSGPLTQLPFQVLVTKAPTSGDSRAVAWLAREHAVTVLPAVSSLKALRRIGKPSTAPKPMIGFGNPLLDGPNGSHAASAKLARERQRCPKAQAGAGGARWPSPRGGAHRGAEWPTCRTSGGRSRCLRPPTSCALWPGIDTGCSSAALPTPSRHLRSTSAMSRRASVGSRCSTASISRWRPARWRCCADRAARARARCCAA